MANTAAPRCPPSRNRAALAERPARWISASKIVVLPMPATLINRNWPVPVSASPSTDPAAARADSRPISRSAALMLPSWLVSAAGQTQAHRGVAGPRSRPDRREF